MFVAACSAPVTRCLDDVMLSVWQTIWLDPASQARQGTEVASFPVVATVVEPSVRGSHLLGPVKGAPIPDALPADATSRDASIRRFAPTPVMAASQVFLLIVALALGCLATVAAVVMVGGAALLALTASAAAFATEAIVLPLGTAAFGLSLLAIGRVAGGLVHSKRRRERQLVKLQSLLGTGEVRGTPGVPDDPLSVIERAVQHLQSQRAFMLDLIDGLPIGVVAADASGNVRLANRRAHDWSGLPLDLLAAKPHIQDALTGLGCPPSVVFEGSSNLDVQCEAVTPDGRHVWIESRRLAGALPALFTIVDMSGIRAEAAVKREALDFLSHDMRAPLSSIAAIVQTPLADHAPATVERTLQAIARLTYRTLDLANEFLALVHADEVGTKQFEPVCLDELMESIEEEFLPRAQAQGCSLRVVNGSQRVWIKGDAALLARTLRNLVDNALRHCDGGEVRISAHPCPGQVVLTIADSGPGFTANHLLGLAKASASASGFGIGLRFVRRVAQLHGGQFTLANGPQGGALVTLSLPTMTSGCEMLADAGRDQSPPASASDADPSSDGSRHAQQVTCS